MALVDRSCPRCGQTFSSEKLDGLCPACLVASTFDAEPPSDEPAFWEDPVPAKKQPPVRTFSHFEILDELGRGGMGVVYRARDLNTERIIALKVLQAHHLEVDDLVQRFRAEVRAVSSLDHPHVLPIHEVGEHEGIPFFSMKLTTGGSLAHNIGSYLGKPREASQLLAKVSRGVQHAHERGILHRDLKPGNILLDAAGEPYVCDFGLAKWLEDDKKLTMTAAVLGTPHYIAPEQALGSKGLTTAVDIYSLGAILYELLTGRPPFVGASVLETLVASQDKTPERPSSLARNVPKDLETICLKALQHDPNNRYASARAFADDLEAWLTGRPIQARPVGAAEQLWRWAKRNPLPAVLIGILLTVLVTTAIGSTYAALRLEQARKEAVDAQADALKEKQTAENRLVQSLLSQAHATRVAARAGQRTEALDALKQASAIAPSRQIRDEAIAALSLLDVRVSESWKVRDSGQVPPSFSEDLGSFFIEESPGMIAFVNVSDRSILNRFGEPGDAIQFITHFQAKLVATRHSSDTVRIWDVSSGKQVFELSSQQRGSELSWLSLDFAFSPDGRAIAVSEPGGGFGLYDIEAAALRKLYRAEKQPNCVSFDPSGRFVASTTSTDKRVLITELDSHQAIRTLPIPALAHCVAWSQDGQSLAVACRDFNIYVIDVNTGRFSATFSGHRQEVTHVVFHPAGDLLASTSRDKTIRLWSLHSKAQEVLISGCGGEPSLRFSTSAPRLAASDFSNQAYLLEICGQNRICQTLVSDTPGQRATLVGSIDIAPDGSRAVSATYEGIDLWDLLHGQHLHFFPVDQGKEKSVRFGTTASVLYVASRSSGLTEYEIISPDGILALREAAVLSEEPGFIFSSASGQFDRGTAILTSVAKGAVKVIELANGNIQYSLSGQPRIWDGAIHPDQRLIALSYFPQTSGTSANARIYRLPTYELVTELPTGPAGVARFSPNGKWLVTTGVNGCSIWMCDTWQLVARFEDIGNLASFSPDSSILAVSENESVTLIDTKTFRDVAKITPPLFGSYAHRLVFSRDSSVLLAHGNDNSLRVWQLMKMKDELDQMKCGW